MKRFTLSLLITFIFSAAFSQKLYFVYIQAEPEQPFFVKINEKVHSSSSFGYLILSRLRDSSYALTVGFPQNKWPEQKFTLDIRSKDHGYTLRNFGEKGWGIYDIETMAIQMSATANDKVARTETGNVSVFTDILSKASNDPSLKEKPVAVKEDKPATVKEEKTAVSEPPRVVKEEVKHKDTVIAKPDQPVVAKNEETPALSNKEETVTKKEEEKIVPVEAYKRSSIIKKSESSTSEGVGLTFIDDYGKGKKDTIRILIPFQRTNLVETKEPVKEEKKFLDIPENDSVKKKDTEEQKDTQPPAAQVPTVVKSKCPSVASESDFLKLRKKMAGVTGDDAMVDEAKKVFRTKCFSTVQVKNLSALFLNDAGKYKFFDATYTHVSDADAFPSLSAELKDEYYINRFKAMLR